MYCTYEISIVSALRKLEFFHAIKKANHTNVNILAAKITQPNKLVRLLGTRVRE